NPGPENASILREDLNCFATGIERLPSGRLGESLASRQPPSADRWGTVDRGFIGQGLRASALVCQASAMVPHVLGSSLGSLFAYDQKVPTALGLSAWAKFESRNKISLHYIYTQYGAIGVAASSGIE